MYSVSLDEIPESRPVRDRLPAMTGVFTITKSEWRQTKTGKPMVVLTFVCQKPDFADKALGLDSPKGLEKMEFYVLGTNDDPHCLNKATFTSEEQCARGARDLKACARAAGFSGDIGMTEEQGFMIPRRLITELKGREVGLVIAHEFDSDGDYQHRYRDNIKKYLDPKLTKPTFSAKQETDKQRSGDMQAATVSGESMPTARLN